MDKKRLKELAGIKESNESIFNAKVIDEDKEYFYLEVKIDDDHETMGVLYRGGDKRGKVKLEFALEEMEGEESMYKYCQAILRHNGVDFKPYTERVWGEAEGGYIDVDSKYFNITDRKGGPLHF